MRTHRGAPGLVAVLMVGSTACGPSQVATDSGSTSTAGDTGVAQTTTAATSVGSEASAGPPIDVSTSGTLPDPSASSSGATGGSSSTGGDCGCTDAEILDLDEPREGLTFEDRLAMFPAEFNLTWTAVEGSPQTAVSLEVSAFQDYGRYDAGGDPCPLVIDPCLDGTSLSTTMTIQSADGFLVGEFTGTLHHPRPFATEPLWLNSSFIPTDSFFEQVYLGADGKPRKPENVHVYIVLDPVTQQFERFDLLWVDDLVLAELSPA